MNVDKDVMNVLGNASMVGKALWLTGQLDRSLYTKTNKVLEAAGGKWSRSAKAHLFEIDAADRIDQILLTGQIEIPKDEFNFFPTPPAIVKRLLALAEIEAGMRLLEPSAGRGAIAAACVAAGAVVSCIELMKENRDFLAIDDLYRSVILADFLKTTPTPIYDRVVMNPPFAKQADIRHVLHALEHLKPAGRLVSVMSSSVTFRDNRLTTDFRDLVDNRGGSIEDLPDASFKASGTLVRTVVVTIPG